ncbi:hypothetical protein JX266_014207 [Neoarthrinium moseri]|nr:hypothetical protein JX266_014207 [Neoarthrinium moseri]
MNHTAGDFRSAEATTVSSILALCAATTSLSHHCRRARNTAQTAAALASQVKKFLPNLWFGLLVGVTAGLPDLTRKPPRDIRLGDTEPQFWMSKELFPQGRERHLDKRTMYKLLVNTSMALGNQRTPNRSNTVTDHYSASTATSLDTERTGARVARCADDAQGKVITTETARQQTRSAYYAVAHTSPPTRDSATESDERQRTERLWNHSDTGTKHKKDRQRNHVSANEARKLDENATDDSTRQEVGSWSDTLDQHEIDVTQVPVRNPNVTAAVVKVADRVVLICGGVSRNDRPTTRSGPPG